MEALIPGLIEHLAGFVTADRLELFRRVLDQRTRYLTVILEDIYQAQNASAVLRTCDCLGIQDIHIVEESNEYEVNPDVSVGSNRWLTLYQYNNGMPFSKELHNRKPDPEGGIHIVKAISALKERGYRIVATSPNRDGSMPETFDLEKGRSAFMFGTELNGLSRKALDLADEFIQIPMTGFTESYNISVSAAVILYTMRKRLEKSSIDWSLNKEEKDVILLDWLRSSIRLGEQIETKFIEENKPPL